MRESTSCRGWAILATAFMAPERASAVGGRLALRFKKSADGGVVVSFVRADGTSTTGRLGQGGFGAVHDLAHYAVETTLGLRRAFLGLIAEGRDLADFEVKHANRDWPDEALLAECIVGQLTNGVFSGVEPAVEEFNWLVRSALAGARPEAEFAAIDEAAYRAMRVRLAELLARWQALPTGETLALEFAAN